MNDGEVVFLFGSGISFPTGMYSSDDIISELKNLSSYTSSNLNATTSRTGVG